MGDIATDNQRAIEELQAAMQRLVEAMAGKADSSELPFKANDVTYLMSFKGDWDMAKTYAQGDVVSVSGVHYKSLTNGNVGHQPPNPSYWVQYTPTQAEARVESLFGSGNESLVRTILSLVTPFRTDAGGIYVMAEADE